MLENSPGKNQEKAIKKVYKCRSALEKNELPQEEKLAILIVLVKKLRAIKK